MLLAALFAPALAIAADPPVVVKFTDLSKFSDFRNSVAPGPREREGLAGILQRYLEREGAERIPPNTRLLVTITDVDMAGEFRLGSSDVRVIREIYPPRIELDFKLVRADGGTEKEGHRELRDSTFMWGSSPMSNESMRYEKELLDGWLRREFAPPKRSANANR
ncbi:hypothetical protein BWI17_16120 [Betaproteobacteria bacterium GR16-43]|nr:hypothetical protein BWI17_16120 [Betaproteobacteria bacterium GR16-43]